MSPAWISGIAGRAIIVDDLVHGDAKYFRLTANAEGPPEPCGPRHLHNFLSLSPDVEVIHDPGPPPYRDVQATLDRVTRQESALKLGLMALDKRLPDDLRTDVARQAEILLEDESTHEAVRHRLLSIPLPGVADFSKLPEVGRLTVLFETARDSAPLVERISAAWTVAAFRCDSRGQSPLEDAFLEDTLKPACAIHGGFAAFVDAIRLDDSSIYDNWLRHVAELAPFNKPGATPFLREWWQADFDTEHSRRFVAWLSSTSWNPGDVEALKEGRSKPDEAYRSFQLVLRQEDDVDSCLTSLTLELIEKSPDLRSFRRAPDRLHLHFLGLCDKLPATPPLVTPLLSAWYQKHEYELPGKDLGEPLSKLAEALDRALRRHIDYQVLCAAWDELCADTPGGIFIEATSLPGAEWAESPSFPEALGQVLAITAHVLTPCPRRRPLFQTYTKKIMECWLEVFNWDERLIRLADRHQLPRWAVESLPSLFVPLRVENTEYKQLLLWKPFRILLPESGKGKDWWDHGSLCDGLVREVQVTKKLFDSLRKVRDTFEDRRRRLTHGSDQAMEGVVGDAMAHVEDMMSSKNKINRPLSESTRTALADTAKKQRSRILIRNYPILRKSPSLRALAATDV